MKKFGVLFVLLALVACASDDGKSEKPKDEPPAKAGLKTDNLICPQVAILQEAQEAFDYGGEKPDPSQLVAKARMKSIDGDCAYRTDKEKGMGIDITFTLHEVAARGPRLGGSQISFPYFIAVVDPSENILNRQTVTAQFKFSGDSKVVEIDEPLHVFIPLSESALPAGPDYRVLIGFKMPKDQMKDK
jgi:hypothetical protein